VIVLDASVLIGHLDDRDPHHAQATELLVATGAEPLGASTTTLAETLVAPTKAKRLDKAEAALGKLGIAELRLDENAPARLAKLRARTRLKLPDCCVLATAQAHRGAVASFDANLREAARKLGLNTIAG
jgi:toxin FitB